VLYAKYPHEVHKNLYLSFILLVVKNGHYNTLVSKFQFFFCNFMKIIKLTIVLSTSSNVLLFIQCDYVYCELNMLKMWSHEQI
jgi:hypothetical protein